MEARLMSRSLPWRAIVAEWSLAARLAWGERANDILEEGMSNWPSDEQRAFRELMPRVRRGEFPDVEPAPAGPVTVRETTVPEALLWENS
jgi:hypothetical protein